MTLPSPEVALPVALIVTMAFVAVGVGLRVLLADPHQYDEAKSRTVSPKRAVLGLVSPEVAHEMDGDVERGFAFGRRNGRTFVVLNGKLPIDQIR
jgi:hypothetical protein